MLSCELISEKQPKKIISTKILIAKQDRSHISDGREQLRVRQANQSHGRESYDHITTIMTDVC